MARTCWCAKPVLFASHAKFWPFSRRIANRGCLSLVGSSIRDFVSVRPFLTMTNIDGRTDDVNSLVSSVLKLADKQSEAERGRLDPMKFSEWIAAEVARRHVTFGQIHKYTGVSVSSLSEYSLGQALPGRLNISKLAGYFEVPESDIWAMVHADQASTRQAGASRNRSESKEEELDLLLDYVKDMTPEERASVLRFAAFVRAQGWGKVESSGEEGE